MHDLNLVDESFDLKRASEYHLSIQAGLDGFSFCILDIRRNKYVAFRHIPLIAGKPQFLSKKLEPVFDQEEKLTAAYQSVTITYSTNKATLLPKEFATPDSARLVAELTNEISRSEEVRSDDLAGFNSQIVYGCPKELMTLLNRKYTGFRFCHKSIPLISTAISQRNDETGHTLIINFEKKYIRIIALKAQQVLLYNSFYFKNEADFLYYTLHVCQSLSINPETDEILIGGYVADDSGYIRQLKKYLANIHFLNPVAGFNYGNIFDKARKHQFVTLFNSYSCV